MLVRKAKHISVLSSFLYFLTYVYLYEATASHAFMQADRIIINKIMVARKKLTDL